MSDAITLNTTPEPAPKVDAPAVEQKPAPAKAQPKAGKYQPYRLGK